MIKDSFFLEGKVLIDSYLKGQVFLIGQPCEEVLDQLGCIISEEQRDLLKLILLLILGQEASHERIDNVDHVSNTFHFHPCPFHVFLRRGVILVLGLSLVLWLLVFLGMLFIDRSCQHHEKGKENIKVVRLGKPLVDLCQKLAKDIGTSFIINFFCFIVLRLLFLGIEVNIDLIEIALHVDLLKGAIIFPFFSIGDEVAQSVDAIGGNVFSIAITIVHLFLNYKLSYGFWASSSVCVFGSWLDYLTWRLSIFDLTRPLCLILMWVNSAG